MTANFHRIQDLETEVETLALSINWGAYGEAEKLTKNPLAITDADVARFEALRDALTAALAQFTGEGAEK